MNVAKALVSLQQRLPALPKLAFQLFRPRLWESHGTQTVDALSPGESKFLPGKGQIISFGRSITAFGLRFLPPHIADIVLPWRNNILSFSTQNTRGRHLSCSSRRTLSVAVLFFVSATCNPGRSLLGRRKMPPDSSFHTQGCHDTSTAGHGAPVGQTRHATDLPLAIAFRTDCYVANL